MRKACLTMLLMPYRVLPMKAKHKTPREAPFCMRLSPELAKRFRALAVERGQLLAECLSDLIELNDRMPTKAAGRPAPGARASDAPRNGSSRRGQNRP